MEKGITLTTTVIYVIVMLIVVGTVGTITGFFYSGTQNLEQSASSLGEFNKFNAFFLSEVKLKENKIEIIDVNRIVFSSGASFTFVDGGMYKNNVKICSNVKQCQFTSYIQEEKTIIRVYIEIGNDFAKTIEYVLESDVINETGQYEENYTQSYKSKEPNEPNIPSGLNFKYVTWGETDPYEEILSDTKPSNWYNYEKKQWANIKTTSTTANSDGTYNEAYWVWIPRYAYRVPKRPTSTTYSGKTEFQIVFLEGTTDIPVDASVLSGATIKPNTVDEVSVGDWVVHPAFKFGDTQLEGIWVAKYEASSTMPTATNGGGNTTEYQVNVKPNIASWRGIWATNAFDVCKNMTASTGALEGSQATDPHLIKNVDWGAVTYLTFSKYGKNEQVWNNASSTYLTGKAAKTGADVSSTTSCDSYNTGKGPEASTTGNVYGIYDMAGGAWEYVAAYLNISEISSKTEVTSIVNANDEYKDVYVPGSSPATNTSNYEANKGKYGDAMYETSYQGTGTTGWQKDYSEAFTSTNVGILRGGHVGNSTPAGVFAFYRSIIGNIKYYSFRPVFCNI